MKPASSSQANSVFSSGDSRGTPLKLAWERMARRISWLTPRSARIGSPCIGWSGNWGWISQSKSCSSAVTDHCSWSWPSLRAYAVTQASTARACLRKLSDFVNSYKISRACSRFIPLMIAAVTTADELAAMNRRNTQLGFADQAQPERIRVRVEHCLGVAGKDVPSTDVHFVLQLFHGPPGVAEVDVHDIGLRRRGERLLQKLLARNQRDIAEHAFGVARFAARPQQRQHIRPAHRTAGVDRIRPAFGAVHIVQHARNRDF